MRRLWRVGIAQNAVFFFIVLWLRRLGKSAPKSGSCRSSKMSPKFAPGCGARAIRKSTSLKTGRNGALFEVQVGKICTTLWRENDLEVKTLKWKVSADFMTFEPAKFAPRCGARAIRKST